MKKFLFVIALAALPALAGHQVVTTAQDSTAGSLRSAIGLAAAGDTVVFNVPGNDTVVLKNEIAIAKDVVLQGRNLATNKNVVLTQVLTGPMNYRAFHITGGNVILRNMSIHGGKTVNGGALYSDSVGTKVILDSVRIWQGKVSSNGGGVYNATGTMAISSCSLSQNRCSSPYDYTSSPGGGACNDVGKLTIINSAVTGNSSFYFTATNGEGSSAGGGLSNGSGIMIVNNCVVHGNSSRTTCPRYYTTASGGGVSNSGGRMEIFNTTISSNLAAATSAASCDSYGGGIYNGWGSATLVNCTVFNDTSVEFAGAIFNRTGTLNVLYCTVTNNSTYAPSAGIYNDTTYAYFLNSIIVNNSARNTINGAWFDYNGAGGRAFNTLVGVGGLLTRINSDTGYVAQQIFGTSTPTLDSNGGPTMTVAIDSSSVAIGAGTRAGIYSTDTIIGNRPDSVLKMAYHDGTNWRAMENDAIVPAVLHVTEITTDQRGVARKNPPCIGSFESPFQSAPVVNYYRLERDIMPVITLTNNRLCLRFDGKSNANVEVFSLCGRRLYSHSVSAGQGMVNLALPRLATGPVICRMLTQQGVVTRKLIMQR